MTDYRKGEATPCPECNFYLFRLIGNHLVCSQCFEAISTDVRL